MLNKMDFNIAFMAHVCSNTYCDFEKSATLSINDDF